MAYPTLLDIAKANGSDPVVGLIDEASRLHPELTLGAARTIRGTEYKTLVRTSEARGNSFRAANQGTVPVKGTYENRLVEAFIFNPQWQCDKAVADKYEDGASAYIAMEGSSMVEGSMLDICAQFYYGRNAGGNTAGFPGLVDAVDSTMVIDAGGTTAATGSSVWAVKWGPKDVQWVWGANGQLQLSAVREQSVVPDPVNAPTATMTAYIQEILAYPGLQVGSVWSVARVKKVTADSGHTLNDALIGQMVATFRAGTIPDVILMSRLSREQLRASRTAVNPTGREAAIPTDWEGIPLQVTDAILNTEALTL
jgi:hypothetical protein